MMRALINIYQAGIRALPLVLIHIKLSKNLSSHEAPRYAPVRTSRPTFGLLRCCFPHHVKHYPITSPESQALVLLIMNRVLRARA